MQTVEPAPPAQQPMSHGAIRLGLLAIVIALVVLLLLGTLPRLRNSGHLEALAQDVKDTVPTVSVVSPKAQPGGSLTLPGDIEAIEQTAINARTTGYLLHRYVDIGSHVRAGQLMAEVQSPDVDQQGLQAQAQTAQSRATVGQSEADLARLRAAVSQSQAAVSQQMAAVQQARAQVTGDISKLAQSRAAQSQSEAAESGARQAVEQQKANLAQAEAQRDLAATTDRRYQQLVQEGFVAQQDADTTAAALKTASATVKANQAAVSSSSAQLQAAGQAVKAAQAAVASAQSDIDAARENVNAALASLKSFQAAVRQAQASVLSGEATVRANMATVNSFMANQRRYAVLSGFERVLAPFDGVITSRNVDTGALVNPTTAAPSESGATPGTGLFGIARTDVLRIYVHVPQTFMKAVKTGQQAAVLVREFPGRTFEGTVYQVAGALDVNTRTLLTEVHVRNTDGSLRPGMYSQVRLVNPDTKATLRIPANTMVIDANGTRVVSVSGSKTAHFVPITIGRDFGTEVEVASGLRGDEQLIVDPSDDLKEGSAVHVDKGQPSGP